LLIDAGVYVGLPYNDSAPDLGAFETESIPPPITFQLIVSISSGWNMVSVPGINGAGMDVNTWWHLEIRLQTYLNILVDISR